jgi:hypothetical protein
MVIHRHSKLFSLPLGLTRLAIPPSIFPRSPVLPASPFRASVVGITGYSSVWDFSAVHTVAHTFFRPLTLQMFDGRATIPRTQAGNACFSREGSLGFRPGAFMGIEDHFSLLRTGGIISPCACDPVNHCPACSTICNRSPRRRRGWASTGSFRKKSSRLTARRKRGSVIFVCS